jgi:hypothetical protein
VGARLVLAGLVYLVTFVLSYGLLMPAVPPDPTAEASPIPPALAPLVVAALHTAVMGWLILRSRRHGWRLVGTMIALFFGVQSVMSQVESWIFQAYAGYAAHLPAGMIPHIVMAGLLHACLWIPLAVRILGRWRAESGAEPTPDLAEARAVGKWAVAAIAYVVVYFLFGYYVAWRTPAVTAYYQGTDPGSFWLQMRSVLRETPWLPLVQVLRGLAWAALAVVLVRSMRGSVTERALAVGSLFGVVMTAGLLLPNPFMPYLVRMAHLLETGSSNFLFGAFVAWLFGRSRPLRG